MSEDRKGWIAAAVCLILALAYCDSIRRQEARDAKCRAAIRARAWKLAETYCK